ncbi:hypothetical protein FGO68_gene12930 [Halteria grandinella]|uniref:Uncharacterized protein n=1 Tax=Halteria grandinella TaxID=5974 RepID=A0A8J8T3T6_HALGN|nr:hypothetical protein FGO68_gene12930 [Halteria grandinella]
MQWMVSIPFSWFIVRSFQAVTGDGTICSRWCTSQTCSVSPHKPSGLYTKTKSLSLLQTILLTQSNSIICIKARTERAYIVCAGRTIPLLIEQTKFIQSCSSGYLAECKSQPEPSWNYKGICQKFHQSAIHYKEGAPSPAYISNVQKAGAISTVVAVSVFQNLIHSITLLFSQMTSPQSKFKVGSGSIAGVCTKGWNWYPGCAGALSIPKIYSIGSNLNRGYPNLSATCGNF